MDEHSDVFLSPAAEAKDTSLCRYAGTQSMGKTGACHPLPGLMGFYGALFMFQ